MKGRLRVFRLFGRRKEIEIQGTSRTYRFYACHILDRLLTVGLSLFIWAAIFFYFFILRFPRPDSIPVWFRWIGVLYWPRELKTMLKPFLFWMAFPSIILVVCHTEEHIRHRRILRGELTARRGILQKIGYLESVGRGGITREYRFLLETSGLGGNLLHEAYKMPEHLFKEYKAAWDSHACRVELALLPPQNPEKRKDSWGLSNRDVNMLHMRVEHIFWLESLDRRCPCIKNFLFVPERNSLDQAKSLPHKKKAGK